jgi:hypothetical protein
MGNADRTAPRPAEGAAPPREIPGASEGGTSWAVLVLSDADRLDCWSSAPLSAPCGRPAGALGVGASENCRVPRAPRSVDLGTVVSRRREIQ